MLRLRIAFRPVFYARAYTGQSSSFREQAVDEDEENVPQIPEKRNVIKNVYTENEVTAGRSNAEIETFYKQHSITVKGEAPKPVLSMYEMGFTPELKKTLEAKKITEPTPIQSMCWPLAMSGHDMIGVAQTGSGKTLGFLAPAACHINAQEKPRSYMGPKALVLAPTRELAQQIGAVAHEFLKNSMGIRQAILFGGSRKDMQIDALRRNPQLCVATPGRLNDLLRTGFVRLSDTSMLILDEADRMLDMGFEPQIREVVRRIPRTRQTLMFSATWPMEVRQLAQDFMERDAIRVNIGSTELCANKSITQQFKFLENDPEKYAAVVSALKSIQGKVLIFAATKFGVRKLANDLRREDIWCCELHGDLSQAQRDQSIRSFKGNTEVLVATDVAARGLDMKNIQAVINYDFPNTVEDYVHRIGRTGRANEKGMAISFVSEKEGRLAQELIKVLEQAGQEVPEKLRGMSRLQQSPASPYSNKGYQRAKPFQRTHGNWKNYM